MPGDTVEATEHYSLCPSVCVCVHAHAHTHTHTSDRVLSLAVVLLSCLLYALALIYGVPAVTGLGLWLVGNSEGGR